ncbi:YebC/PmpR family DNA-binding transcriptional regulator [Rubritalea marina]|uniref:YebC/PmpR family DNA-binding transcriptional regulator n=1 Tax=Rubritalea marina TaxID=361055 RepID=UPI00036CC2DC|nr:YebC/PmpR family DNA-binding transcriptional regulator [Rubritalea marina]
MGRAFEYRRASKEKRWDKMSKLFPKLGKAITVAAKEGGEDPEVNTKLRAAIATAKAENMPKDNIDKAIARATAKDAVSYTEVNYEGKGPHGVLIWVECATDNNTRTFTNVRTIFNKSGGSLMPSGGLEFMFTRKAVVKFKKPEGQELEEVELELIDHGLEELEDLGEEAVAYGEFTSFGSLSKGVEELGLEITKAAPERIANNSNEFTEEQLEEIEAFLDKLEDDDDVQNVFTNIA